MRSLRLLAGVSAATWLALLVGRGRFWRVAPQLPAAPATPEGDGGWPAVLVVVPARDEAAVLPRTLPTLLAQDYPGAWRVVLVDDHSGDGTAEVAGRLAASAGREDRLAVVPAPERPPGWAGKVSAMRAGVTSPAGLATEAGWVLLTDADIAHPPDSLRRLVSHALADRRDVVSLMALLHAATPWERLLVPAFVYFFAQLYPFSRVAADGARTAAAAGGCLLIRRDLLADATADFAAMRDAVIDDVTLARLVARAGGRLWLGHTRDVTSVRGYPRLADLWEMVARSADTQLRHSRLLLAGTTGGLLVTYVVPPLAALAGQDRVTRLLGAGTWLAMAATYRPMVRHYGLRSGWAATLPAAAVLYLGMTLDSARRHARGAGPVWKGRPAL